MKELPAYEIFFSNDDDGYIARIIEIPECSGFGNCKSEALRELSVAWQLHQEIIRI